MVKWLLGNNPLFILFLMITPIIIYNVKHRDVFEIKSNLLRSSRYIYIYIFFNPFPPSVPIYMASFSKTFDFNFRRDHQKNFLWASRLWVGRRKEPIVGYVPKNDEKKNSGGKGLIESILFRNNYWFYEQIHSFY